MLSIGRTINAAVSKCTPIAGLMASRAKHSLPDLRFDYKALEPIISGEIMEIHHSKHHQTYVTNYNKAEEQLQEALEKNDTTKIISLQNALRFNGGGHINHEIFWQNLTPDKTVPSIELNEAIGAAFGNFDDFKKEFSSATVAVQGSGWGWLGYNRKKDRVYIATCLNQDPLEATTGLIPLLGIDVWEHAYYLQYKNVRANYVDALFDVVNWDDVSARLTKARNPETN